MANDVPLVTRLLAYLAGMRDIKPYQGPTFGLHQMGIPVYQARMSPDVVARAFPWSRAIYVNPEYGLSAPTVEHELQHLRDIHRYGPVGFSVMWLMTRGKPFEKIAYRQEAKTREREAAEKVARVKEMERERRLRGR